MKRRESISHHLLACCSTLPAVVQHLHKLILAICQEITVLASNFISAEELGEKVPAITLPQ